LNTFFRYYTTRFDAVYIGLSNFNFVLILTLESFFSHSSYFAYIRVFFYQRTCFLPTCQLLFSVLVSLVSERMEHIFT